MPETVQGLTPILDIHDRMPQHAAAIASCIANWSQVDGQLSILFGILIGAVEKADAAASVFAKIKGQKHRRDLIGELAQKRIPADPRYGMVVQVVRKIADVGSLRDRLAHAVLGIHGAREDVVAVWNSDDVPWIGLPAYKRIERGEPLRDAWTEAKGVNLFSVQELRAEAEKAQTLFWDVVHLMVYLTASTESDLERSAREHLQSMGYDLP